MKESLLADFVHKDDPQRAAELGVGNPFWEVEYDFVMLSHWRFFFGDAFCNENCEMAPNGKTRGACGL